MSIDRVERTIVEYSLKLTGEDAELCLRDPFSFGEKVREELLPYFPAAAPASKPGADSQFTFGKAGRHSAKRAAKKAGARKAAPKSTAGGGAPHKLKCPHCPKEFITKGRLNNHLAREHSAPASGGATWESSTPSATAPAAE